MPFFPILDFQYGHFLIVLRVYKNYIVKHFVSGVEQIVLLIIPMWITIGHLTSGAIRGSFTIVTKTYRNISEFK